MLLMNLQFVQVPELKTILTFSLVSPAELAQVLFAKRSLVNAEVEAVISVIGANKQIIDKCIIFRRLSRSVW